MLFERMSKYTEPQKVKKKGLYPYFRVIESEQDTTVLIKGKRVLMFGSNSYLGLTSHPKLKEAAKNAVDKYGTGCAGSRFLNGTLDLHIQLEEKLADFVKKESAIVFSTGYQVNLGVLSCLTGRRDYIILDNQNHACIIDGARLSFSPVLKYRHNNMDSLERALEKASGGDIKLIATDGVFSMEGDVCKLERIVELAKKYSANIMIDDAHGLGVLGEGGRGTCSHLNLTEEVDLIMGTFSKSLASVGGFIASDSQTINWLKHNARTLIFSASISPANAASASAALDIIKQEPERIDHLWENTRYALEGLKGIGVDTGSTETPIIPIYIRDRDTTFMITQMLLDEGVFVNPVIEPAVSSESSLLRFSLMATHTKEQIDRAIDRIDYAFTKLGIHRYHDTKSFE